MLGMILGILWFIVKIILWIILGILGLLLLLLLMALFVPIRYSVEASKYERVTAKVRVTYLLRLFRIHFDYSPDGYAYRVMVLFFKVLGEEVSFGEDASEGEKSETEGFKAREAASQLPLKEAEKVEEPDEVPDEKVHLKVEPEITEPKKVPTEPEVSEKTDRANQQGSEPAREKKGTPEKPKSQGTFQDREEGTKETATAEKKSKIPKKTKNKKKSDEEAVLDKVKRFYGFLREERNIGVLRFILKKVFKAVGSVLPRRFYGKIHFGMEDPAMTAYIIGATSIFYPKYKESLYITGDFEHQVVEGEVRIKGRVIPGIFVWAALRIYMDGRVRRLIKEVRK